MAKTTEKEKIRTETAYTISELAVNAGKIFGTRPECAAAALRFADGAKTFTVAEAKEIVSKFLNREVK